MSSAVFASGTRSALAQATSDDIPWELRDELNLAVRKKRNEIEKDKLKRTSASRDFRRAGEGTYTASMHVDTAAKTAMRAGEAVDLTAREYAILEYLMLRQGAVVSRTEIEEHIYDELVSPMSNVVDSAVCNLRRKIATHPESEPLIHTRRGQGYILERRAS